jgi:L-fuculokinase
VICARFMGGRYHEILSPAGSPEPAVEDLQAVIASGALALPGFSGASGPFPNGPGVVEGALPPGPAMRAALAALYLALMTDHCIDLIGAGGDIVIEGAFAGNAAYASLLAGLRPGRTVLVSRDATGTSQGAAMLARWGGPHAAPASAPVGPCNVPGLSAYRAAWLARIGGLSAAGPAA